MHELTGDLWARHAAGDVVAITTGGAVDKKGSCLMPRGCAAQARKRFSGIEKVLGEMVRKHGVHVYDLGNRIVSFPVENSPFEVPSLHLIEQSCRELVSLVDRQGWERVIVPRPGCGGGGLSWQEVRPILERHFDARFHIISQEIQ
ncbi:MAG: ADP-ribose-binding protein [Desulfuromonas sp.]|nr:MAG: ADP-ribose-binding protein [Desulfuromonas sp.]